MGGVLLLNFMSGPKTLGPILHQSGLVEEAVSFLEDTDLALFSFGALQQPRAELILKNAKVF